MKPKSFIYFAHFSTASLSGPSLRATSAATEEKKYIVSESSSFRIFVTSLLGQVSRSAKRLDRLEIPLDTVRAACAPPRPLLLSSLLCISFGGWLVLELFVVCLSWLCDCPSGSSALFCKGSGNSRTLARSSGLCVGAPVSSEFLFFGLDGTLVG